MYQHTVGFGIGGKEDLLFPHIFGTWTFGSVAISGWKGVFVNCGSTKNRRVRSGYGSSWLEGTSSGLGEPAQEPHQWVAAFAAAAAWDGVAASAVDWARDRAMLAKMRDAKVEKCIV